MILDPYLHQNKGLQQKFDQADNLYNVLCFWTESITLSHRLGTIDNLMWRFIIELRVESQNWVTQFTEHIKFCLSDETKFEYINALKSVCLV